MFSNYRYTNVEFKHFLLCHSSHSFVFFLFFRAVVEFSQHIAYHRMWYWIYAMYIRETYTACIHRTICTNRMFILSIEKHAVTLQIIIKVTHKCSINKTSTNKGNISFDLVEKLNIDVFLFHFLCSPSFRMLRFYWLNWIGWKWRMGSKDKQVECSA